MNKGYADFDNIVYNVYRVNLISQTYEQLSANQKELTFSEALSDEGIYCYVVEAVSGGVIGGCQDREHNCGSDKGAALYR